jgi:general secretion pathway protein F/type IV pilus assembly protein PilC
MVSITRFCRILGTMLANGVNLLQALAISKDATGCRLMSRSIEDAAEAVRGGESLAEPLRKSGLFPAEIVEMIAVGEESNQLEKVLVQIADTVERRTNRQVDQAVRLIEPLILVLLAGTIGFVAVGLMYPIFTMSQTLR